MYGRVIGLGPQNEPQRLTQRTRCKSKGGNCGINSEKRRRTRPPPPPPRATDGRTRTEAATSFAHALIRIRIRGAASSFCLSVIHSRLISSPTVCTDLQERAKARLRELPPAARGSQEAGFTQPSLRLFLYVCSTQWCRVLSERVREISRFLCCATARVSPLRPRDFRAGTSNFYS